MEFTCLTEWSVLLSKIIRASWPNYDFGVDIFANVYNVYTTQSTVKQCFNFMHYVQICWDSNFGRIRPCNFLVLHARRPVFCIMVRFAQTE